MLPSRSSSNAHSFLSTVRSAASAAGTASETDVNNMIRSQTFIVSTILQLPVARAIARATLTGKKEPETSPGSNGETSNRGNAHALVRSGTVTQFGIAAVGVYQRRARASLEGDDFADENQMIPARIAMDIAAGETRRRALPKGHVREPLAPGHAGALVAAGRCKSLRQRNLVPAQHVHHEVGRLHERIEARSVQRQTPQNQRRRKRHGIE